MDVRRLIPKIKLPSIIPATKSIWKDSKYVHSFLPIFLALGVFVILIVAIWWLSPYLGSVYALVPGYYHIDTYNTITLEKNAINDENSQLFDRLQVLEDRYNEISATEEGYREMIQVDGDMITVLQDIEGQLERSIELDEKLLTLRLPSVVQQYVLLAGDLDEIQIEVNMLSQDVSGARRDLNELRLRRSEFDNCLIAIDWNSTEKGISEAISQCTTIVPLMQEVVGRMEIEYGADLEDLGGYLILLKEEWDAESSYYLSISEKNYTKAKEYDDIFADRKRQISETDVVLVFNEFSVETLIPLQQNLIDLRARSELKEKTATQWYTNSIAR